jgi:hypothetical protein
VQGSLRLCRCIYDSCRRVHDQAMRQMWQQSAGWRAEAHLPLAGALAMVLYAAMISTAVCLRCVCLYGNMNHQLFIKSVVEVC